ncbi:MAG: tetratricopeptide repeat protein [Chitinophagaceae bacterium]|nr:tetratricopeptide repeat protein [Chitinophagaceae bacterium]
MKLIVLLLLLNIVSVTSIAQNWEELNNEVLVLYGKEDYDKARLVAEKAIVGAEKEFGKDHINYATSLYNLGKLNEILRKYSNAEGYYLELLGVRKKSGGEDSPEYASLLNVLGVLYSEMEQYERAEQYLKMAVESQGRILGKLHNNYITSLENLAFVLAKQGKNNQSESVSLEALAAKKKNLGEADPGYLSSLKKLGKFYQDINRYDQAEIYFQKAIKIAEDSMLVNNRTYTEFLFSLAGLYKETGEYAKAEPWFKKTIQSAQKTVGTEHIFYGIILNDLASMYSYSGKYKQADTLYNQSLLIARKINGNDHPNVAYALNNLGILYTDMGLYSKAEPAILEGLRIRKKHYGDQHIENASSYLALGNLYSDQGKFEEAVQYYLEAIAIRKKFSGEESIVYATYINNLALVYHQMGLFKKAESLFIQSMDTRKRKLGEKHPLYAQSLNNLAAVYSDLAQYEKAEKFNLEAAELRKQVFGPDNADYAASLNNLANNYEAMGMPEKAEPLLLQARAIYEKALGIGHPHYIKVNNNLAAMYSILGQFQKAEELCRISLDLRKKILGPDHPEYASSLNWLASIFKNTWQYEKAEPLYTEALAIRKRTLGEDHPDYASTLYNLAVLYRIKGKTKLADSLIRQVITSRGKVLGEAHPDYADALAGLAFNYTLQRRYPEAESLYLQSLAIRKNSQGVKSPAYSGNLFDLAKLYSATGEYRKADSCATQNCLLYLERIKNSMAIFSETEKRAYLENNSDILRINHSFLFNHRNHSPAYYLNNYNLQLSLNSMVLSDSRTLLNQIIKSNDTAIQRIYTEWLSGKSFLSKQYSKPVSARSQELKSRETEVEEMEKDLGRRSTAFRTQQASAAVSVRDIQLQLDNDEIAIEFVRFRLYNKKWTDSIIYAAYILNKKDSVPVFVPLCEERQLEKLFDSAGNTATSMVNSFYRGTEIRNKSAAKALGNDLYNLVWAPLEPYLIGIKKVNYSPAGKLYSVAFHALRVDSFTLLMDKYQLKQFTGTRQIALQDQHTKGTKPERITLFGDAIFTLDSTSIVKANEKNKKAGKSSNVYSPPNRGSRGGTWVDLPGTAQEVKKIKQVFEKNEISSTLYVQTAASEENLKGLSGHSPQVLHIATHGFFLPEPELAPKETMANSENSYTLAEDPLLRSGLILAGGNYAWSGKTPIEGVEDGIVTAYEISQLNLSNTELVVLSACETALGDVKGSEGVFGLQRAFKMAGVKKLIVSLWQVPDKETAELMTAFYGYWLGGKKIEDAFSQAQTDMRKKYPPYYWAAFVLVE